MSLDTLRSQAFGAKNYELVGILTQRGTLICSLLMIPCGLSWWFATGPVLRGIGVDEEIVELSALYCKVALGNLWPMLTQNMAIGFLRCQRIVKPVTWMQAATQVITLPLSYVLITTYGYIGGAIAESINGWIMFFTTMLLIKWKGYHKKCWHGWSSESLKEWGPIIKLGSAGALQSFGQMCSFEVTAAMSSMLGAIPLAAHSCAANMNMFMWPIIGTIGMMATTVRVGNLMGEGRPKQAKLTGKVSVFICVSIMLCFIVLLNGPFKHDFARVYSADERVIELASTITPQLSGYLLAFGCTMGFRGTIGGCGKQVQSARLGLFTWCATTTTPTHPLSRTPARNLHSQASLQADRGRTVVGRRFCVGLPMGALFCFQFEWELAGLWGGLCVGGAFQVTSFSYWLFRRMDWTAESKKARARALGKKGKG